MRRRRIELTRSAYPLARWFQGNAQKSATARAKHLAKAEAEGAGGGGSSGAAGRAYNADTHAAKIAERDAVRFVKHQTNGTNATSVLEFSHTVLLCGIAD